MRKLSVLGVLWFAAFFPTAWATTWKKESQKCPICNETARGSVPGSAYIAGSSMEFRPNGVDLTLAGLLACGSCGFTAYPTEFSETKGLNVATVRQALVQLKSPRYFSFCDRAIAVERHWKNRTMQLARLTLSAKWAADDTGEPQLIQRRRQTTIDAHLEVLEKDSIDDTQREAITYLLGELYRQATSRELAEKWLTKATQSKTRHLQLMAQQQLFWLRNAQRDPQDIAESIEELPIAAQVTAIPLFRKLDDKATVEWLQRVCLECPDDLRESAISNLVGQIPLRVQENMLLRRFNHQRPKFVRTR